MTTKPQKICLGLQEQVEYNKLNIEKHYEINRVIASIGFNFEGVVATENDLPDDYTGEIGDAYAVGTYPDYIYYIWSRANPALNEPTNYWFKFGPLVLKGPAGESTRWYSFESDAPSILQTIEDPKVGDMGLLSNGDVYIYAQTDDGIGWYYATSIKGPRGETTDWTVVEILSNTATTKPAGNMLLESSTGEVYRSDGTEWMYQADIKGPKGEPGERGSGLVILGDDLASVDALPSPTTIRRDGGYLVMVNGVKHLFCVIGTGTTDDPLRWDDLGAFAYTIEVPKTKYYKHTVNLRFNLEYYNSSQYLTVIIINQSPDPITPTTFWNEIKNKITVIPKIDYGNGQWYMLYDINSFSYDWDDWYGYDIYGCIMGSSEGITLSQQLSKDGGILSIYDGVIEL